MARQYQFESFVLILLRNVVKLIKENNVEVDCIISRTISPSQVPRTLGVQIMEIVSWFTFDVQYVRVSHNLCLPDLVYLLEVLTLGLIGPN